MQRTKEGLLCVSQQELVGLQLTHLLSGMDTEDIGVPGCGRTTTLSGYTEWVCPQAAALSLGWDWYLRVDASSARPERLGLPRTNIQVLDTGLQPLPWESNLKVLAELIDGLEWASPALNAVSVPM